MFELSTKDENEARVNDLEPMDMISSTVLAVRRFGILLIKTSIVVLESSENDIYCDEETQQFSD